jgi:hypothetical protein
MNSFRLSPTRYLATTVVVAGAVALLGMRRGATDRPVPTLRIVAVDYGYQLPKEVAAGPTRLELVNQGHELHHAQLIRLEQGRTLADLTTLDPGAPPPAWVVPVGGPGAVGPGDSSSVIQTLTPGQYVLMCWIPSLSDHKEHRMKGMVAGFRVTAGTGAQAKLPKPDVTVRMLDFGYAPSAPLVAGKRNIRVVNDGPQLHEMVLAMLPAGKTAADLLAWNPETATEPPPARYLGGTVALPPGGEAIVEATLEAGNYVLICYIPDAKDGKPHFAHGMVLPFTVQQRGV